MPKAVRTFSAGRALNSLGKSSRHGWAVRGLLALGAGAAGAISLSNSLANVIVGPSPASAYVLAPADGRVLAALAQEGFSVAPDSNTNSQQARLAKRALRLDATAVDALNVLAMQAEMRAESAMVDQLFGYSFALSRRELQPQIWMIEKAVERGDIEGALSNYDLALRTSRRAQQTLFPVLASALAEVKVRRAVLRLLVTKPVWTVEFLDYASAQGRDLQAVARLFRDGAGRLPIEEVHRVRLVNGLAAQGLMEQAWDFYTTFRSGAARDRSRDPQFELQVETPSIFDWTTGTAPGLSAAIVPGANGGYLEFSVSPSTPAVVATQTQILPPGRYRIAGTSAGIDQPERSPPYWALTCQAGGELGRASVPNSTTDRGRFSGEFTVTSNCPVQTLSLVVRASGKASGVFGQITEAQLAPLNP